MTQAADADMLFQQAHDGSWSPAAAKPDLRRQADLEEKAKAQAIEKLQRVRRGWLTFLRGRLIKLYESRVAVYPFDAYVTADDARVILESQPDCPPASELNRSFLGALFKTAGWESTGKYITSNTPGSHANRLVCWRYVCAGAGQEPRGADHE